jgi:hypothetical protein
MRDSRIAPELATVSAGPASTLWLDGATGPSVRSMTAKLDEQTRLPASLNQLRIHLAHGTDDEVAALLSSVRN